MLTLEQQQRFNQDGFLVIPDFLNDQEVSSMRSRIDEIVDEFNMDAISVFSTTNQIKTADAYFIESGGKIRCFFEEDAFDDGVLVKPKTQSINKVGHALHDLDEVFKQVSYKAEMKQVAKDIGMINPLVVQSQYIFKQPRIGGKVVAHQDSTFIYTDPPSCMGFWMALEDANMQNGCLMGIPGSHLQPLPERRFVRKEDGTSTSFKGVDNPQWDLDKMVPLEAPKGALVLLHGACVHMSLENRSSHSRHAYIIHMVEQGTSWPTDNWLQRSQDFPFKLLYEN